MCEEESVRGLTGYLTLTGILHATTFFLNFFCMCFNFCLNFLVLLIPVNCLHPNHLNVIKCPGFWFLKMGSLFIVLNDHTNVNHELVRI